MQLDRFTIKSQEALQAALSLAAARQHAQVLPEHLLAALLEQPDGLVAPVLRKLGASPDELRRTSPPRSTRCPTPPAPASRPPPASCSASCAPPSARPALGDEYISVEHLLLALAAAAGAAGEALRRNGDDAARQGAAGGARLAPRHRPVARGQVQGARELRPRPHAAGPRGQARPGDRPRRRDPPRHPGPLAPHEEQPRPDRRARRRQDGDRRGPRPAHRRRGRARVAARPQGHRARHRRAAGRLEVPRASSRSA